MSYTSIVRNVALATNRRWLTRSNVVISAATGPGPASDVRCSSAMVDGVGSDTSARSAPEVCATVCGWTTSSGLHPERTDTVMPRASSEQRRMRVGEWGRTWAALVAPRETPLNAMAL